MRRQTFISLFCSATLFTGLAQAQDPRFQDAVDAMKMQWQAGIPVAGVVALEDLHPERQIRRKLDHALDQVMVRSAAPLGSSQPQSDKL